LDLAKSFLEGLGGTGGSMREISASLDTWSLFFPKLNLGISGMLLLENCEATYWQNIQS